jgi:hypothetical protein
MAKSIVTCCNNCASLVMYQSLLQNETCLVKHVRRNEVTLCVDFFNDMYRITEQVKLEERGMALRNN